MSFQRSALAAAATILTLVAVGACGSNPGTPIAPSSALAPAVFASPVIAAAETSGYVITSIVSGTSCPTLQFMIQTYVIKTDTATKYAGGSCSSLRAGTKLTTLTGSRPSNNQQILYASQITIQAAAAAPVPASVTTDGTVTSMISGTACPDLQFTLGSYLFKISPATAYSQAACADVTIGAHVYVAGTKRDGDSFVLVTGLGLKRDGTTTPPSTTPTGPSAPTAPAPVPFETTVTVSSLVATSACPYREFMVGGYKLTTSAMTRYENGNCSDIAPGATLAIVATKGDRDTSVLVGSITFKGASEPGPSPSDEFSTDVTVGGVVTGSACPALSFLVGPYTVTAGSATRYDGGMCTDIKPGVVLRLTGSRQDDDHVLASRIAFPD